MWVIQPRIHKTDYYVFNMGMRLWEAAEPTNTRASATRATPTQPGFAQPHRAQDPRFQAPAGCRQAHTGQPSHLAAGSHSWRARRPDTARRPGAEAFAHSFAIPLHLNHPGLGLGSVLARSSPQMR